MKELNISELSVRQKLGIVMTSTIRSNNDTIEDMDDNLEFTLELIKNRSLGAVWVVPKIKHRAEIIEKIRETADYPLLIISDAEGGIGEHLIGRHNTIGMADSEELAYMFGKVTGISARQMGYNVIGSPVLDCAKEWGGCDKTVRSLGSDKYRLTALAKAVAQGLQDGGVLTIAKHYPSSDAGSKVDTHMQEGCSDVNREELLANGLYPYIELMKEGLLDAIMVGHERLTKIDPKYPASLSPKVINIIREQGFDGFAITDALEMMGIKSKFGAVESKGLSIAAGIDICLPWGNARMDYEALCTCYEKGIITDDRLDEAVRRVLEAQHKVWVREPKYTELTPEDIETFDRLNWDSVFAKADDGIEPIISRDGKHYFVLLVENRTSIDGDGRVPEDTFSDAWLDPIMIKEKIEELFPNSSMRAIHYFPTALQNRAVMQDSIDYDDVIFITHSESGPYVGIGNLTHRIVTLIEALQKTNRISAVVHFGIPHVLEELPHIPRVIIGCVAKDSTMAALEVLAGKYPAKGVLTYDVSL